MPGKTSMCTNKSVIAVGRLNYQKGFDYLIEAWRIVNRAFPDWKLNIYGEGELRITLQRQIDRYDLSSTVTLCGATNDIIEKYVESSIFVLSSRDEAFGLVITEAEACGLPIVAFNCPSGPQELIEDNKNGYLISSIGNVEFLADRVIKLMSDELLRQNMGHASLDFSKEFKMERIGAKWLKLYNKLLES